ncbi:MAG: V-type ATP synthase subunit K [Clostridia bacterium]|nr:V-type ATP synthase subunit K [Clostridia bacterium]MBQ9481906.1 V-type ATP synthase subunit K [Clostridia bacterium]
MEKAIGFFGLALCMILCGAGSALGLYKTGTAAAGVLSEDPKKFSKVMILVVLPATQGIYGFVIAILGVSAGLTGWELFAKVFPMAVVGFISAYFQGKTAANCIYAVAKQETLSGKLILFPAMVETYAILALVISILIR